MINMKEIKNYENYLISDNGEIYNIKKCCYMKPNLGKSGYYRIKLSNNGVKKIFLVHRLVAETYLKNEFNKPQVNHINGIKTDNNIKNLEWSTRQENMQHAYKNGLMKGFYEKAHKIVINTQNGVFYDSLSDAANSLNMNYSTLRSMLQGHRFNKTHLKYA